MKRIMTNLFVFLLLPLILITGCEKSKSPVKIGLVGGLTGRHSDLGINGRNGAIYAVEEINRTGGINGRNVELISKDDKQDPDIARQVVRELIDEKVTAIVGHFTSAMSMATVDEINKAKLVMVSPTTSTNLLTSIDDYFIRVMSPNKAAIDELANYMFNALGLRRIAVVYDKLNEAYSKSWYDRLADQQRAIDGLSVIPIPYTSSQELKFADLAAQVLAESPDGILVVTAALDASMLCQQFRKSDTDTAIFSTMWAMTEDFIQHGGPAAEDVTFAHWFYKEYQSSKSENFRNGYQERFGEAPIFASYFAYEAAVVIFAALKVNDDPADLKKTILNLRKFDGTQGVIEIDEYGDPKRKVFLMTVKDGKFVSLE
jgi:branched-chain amino acid transport system substrate-binding protein